MRRVCVVIMWSLQTRFEKSYSYSISYSYSNLKVPIVFFTTVCIQLTAANVTSEIEQLTRFSLVTKKLCISSIA